MLLASIVEFQNYIGNSAQDSNIKETLIGYLVHASSALETRLESSFERATRVSFFSIHSHDLLSKKGDALTLKLGSGFIDPASPIIIRYSTDKSMLMDESDGAVYDGKFIADRVKGLIHIPKSVMFEGDFVFSVEYVCGFEKVGKDYKNVPTALKNAALGYATQLFFTQPKMNNSARYNKFNHSANRQTIKDAHDRYVRPRTMVVHAELDKVKE